MLCLYPIVFFLLPRMSRLNFGYNKMRYKIYVLLQSVKSLPTTHVAKAITQEGVHIGYIVRKQVVVRLVAIWQVQKFTFATIIV